MESFFKLCKVFFMLVSSLFVGYFAAEKWVITKIEAAEKRVMNARETDMKFIADKINSMDAKLNILIQRR